MLRSYLQVAIAAVFIATPVFCSPNYIKYHVVPWYGDSDAAKTTSDADPATVTSTAETPSPAPIYYWFESTAFFPESVTTVNYWLFGSQGGVYGVEMVRWLAGLDLRLEVAVSIPSGYMRLRANVRRRPPSISGCSGSSSKWCRASCWRC